MPKEKFQETEEIRDNKIQFSDEYLYVYEAPSEDDPGRGYYSIWNEMNDGEFYKQEFSMSGDDGMIFEKFQNQERLR